MALLAKCPSCDAEVEADPGQDYMVLRSLLLAKGWGFDQQGKVWRCPVHKERRVRSSQEGGSKARSAKRERGHA